MTVQPDPATPLRTWLDQAQDSHAEQPVVVAAALAARAATLPADADGAEAIQLAEHLMLGHLADAVGLQAFIDRLPAALHADEATAPAVQRAAWALAHLVHLARPDLPDLPDQPDLPDLPDLPDQPDLPEAARWRALQNVVLALASQGRSEAAGALLLADEAEAAAAGASAAGKAYAASANNVAAHLCAGPRGDNARDALMLSAAQLSRRAWASAGTWLHAERAEYRLALCHVALGQGEAALVHARLCLAVCEAQSADAVEQFFALEALVLAHHAAGQLVPALAASARMHALLPAVSEDDGLRAWCRQAFDALPAL
jgi:hypothetical protein